MLVSESFQNLSVELRATKEKSYLNPRFLPLAKSLQFQRHTKRLLGVNLIDSFDKGTWIQLGSLQFSSLHPKHALKE